MYEGRSINKLQNGIILIMFIVWKIRNMRFIGNIIGSTKYEFYFDDVTVTSFIDIKYGNVAAFNVDKWRHSDVIVIKLTAGTQHKIP